MFDFSLGNDFVLKIFAFKPGYLLSHFDIFLILSLWVGVGRAEPAFFQVKIFIPHLSVPKEISFTTATAGGNVNPPPPMWGLTTLPTRPFHTEEMGSSGGGCTLSKIGCSSDSNFGFEYLFRCGNGKGFFLRNWSIIEEYLRGWSRNPIFKSLQFISQARHSKVIFWGASFELFTFPLLCIHLTSANDNADALSHSRPLHSDLPCQRSFFKKKAEIGITVLVIQCFGGLLLSGNSSESAPPSLLSRL